MNASLKIALAVIVKNEADSLLDWVAFHRSVGINHFLVMDNGSTDDTWPILKHLRKRNIVRAHRFRTLAGQAPQIDAYQAILGRYAKAYDAIVFLDADEYLVPTDGSTSVIPAIEELFGADDVSAVVLNWACFGSSGLFFREPGMVPERFVRRAEQGHPMNRHCKSIVRPERVVRFYNPHQAWVASGHEVNTQGGKAVFDPERRYGFTKDLCWNRLRVNHYVVKSLEEFLVRKSRVGNAAWPDKAKHKAFFEGHDRNEVKDDSILPLIPAAKRVLEQLEVEVSLARSQELQLAKRFSWYWQALYNLARRFRLYGRERLKYGSLSLKDRNENS